MPKVDLPNIVFKSTVIVEDNVFSKDTTNTLYEFPISSVLTVCDSLQHERVSIVSDTNLINFLEVYGIATRMGNPKSVRAKMIPDYNFKIFYKVVNKEFVKTINELTGAL